MKYKSLTATKLDDMTEMNIKDEIPKNIMITGNVCMARNQSLCIPKYQEINDRNKG